ncbi:protein of unknown function [Candidatus Nitrotoga arctica]|uniref:Uncharacterized protein n=1 Tax=Candidatus Nitrotoga arctica TaxID=453162 RepID=A0ABN8AP07_9PROT|nr:protein of unknown function [Candidatus Nitrotoga arctica]
MVLTRILHSDHSQKSSISAVFLLLDKQQGEDQRGHSSRATKVCINLRNILIKYFQTNST